MAYRKRNWTSEQLRAKFLQVAEGERWFEGEDFAETWAAQQQSSSGNVDWNQYEGAKTALQRIKKAFGPPPWEFLLPGDPVPPILISGGGVAARRQTIRSPEANPMRVGHVNYASKGAAVQFVDSMDKDLERHFWIPGSGPLVDDVTSSAELFERLSKIQQDSGSDELDCDFRRPIRSHRTGGVEAPEVNETLTFFLVSNRRGRATVPSVEVMVTAVFVKPRYATGKVHIRSLRPGA